MADEGELAFVATMRDEATAQARAARRQLDALGGDTKPITIPLNVDADTKKALAEVKKLQAQVRRRKLDLDMTTTAAKAKLAELKGQIAKAKADLRVDVNDAEARATLSRLQAEYDQIRSQLVLDASPAQSEIAHLQAEIAARKVHIGVEVDGAKAVAEAAAVNAAIGAAIDETKRVRVDLDTTSLTEASKGVSGLLTAIVLLGPATLPILAAITVALGGLGAGLIAAAGAGGILGISIAGQVKGMTDARTAITATQKKLDGYTKGTKEYRDTLKELRGQQSAFNKQFGPAASGFTAMSKAWHGFQADTRTASLGVIGASLKAVAQILRVLAPTANAAAGGVRILIGEFRKWARGPELGGILRFFRVEGPGMIVSFGHIAGNVISGILQLFMAFAPEMHSITGGLEGMTASFRAWSSHLGENQQFQAFLEYARTNLPAVGRLIGQTVLVVARLAEAWAPFGTTILSALNGILSAIHALPIPVIQALSVAIGLVVLALKAWQVGVFAVVAAQRVATVSTLAYTAATKGFATATSSAFGKLGVAAVGIAGVSAAAKQGGGAMSILGGAASGAMAGAALGSFFPGPGTAIGGIIGGLGGLTAGLLTAGHSAKQSGADARASIGSWQDYAATLDQVTGATTRATRQTALQNLVSSKIIPTLNSYGISTRQAVDAIVNGGSARDILNQKLGQEQAGYDKTASSAQAYYRKLSSGDATRRKGDGDVTLAVLAGAKKRADAAKSEADAHRADGDAIRRQLGLATQGIAKGREELAITRTFTKAIKSLPPRVQTALETKILRPKEIVDLVATYRKMQNIKSIRTLITENGGHPTQAQIERILARAKELAHTRAEAKLAARDGASPVIAGANRALSSFNGRHATATMTVVRRITGAVNHAATGFGLFGGDAAGGTIGTRSRVVLRRAMGGPVPGSRQPYRDSVLAYLAPGEEVISNARGQADAFRRDRDAGLIPAYAAGGRVHRKGGKKKGPNPAVVLAAQRRGVLAGLPGAFEKKSVEQVAAAQGTLNDRLDAYYKKRIKNAKAAAAASKAARKSLADELAAVKKNAAARDVVVAKIKAAQAAGAAAADTARQQLDITSISVPNDAPVTAGFIVQGLQARVAALAKFQTDLAKLRKAGVDKDLVGQLAQQGVDSAGAYASALTSATKDQLAAVNKAQAGIRSQAAKIGADTTAGLAAGLSSQLAKIDAAGVRLANVLLKAVRRRLGIKSPSRELRRDGRHSVAGMVDGIRREIPAAEAQAAALAARVQAAAVPSLGHLTALANSASAVSVPSVQVIRVEGTVTIRHEVTSPDSSISNLTAEQLADLIARSPKAAAAIERALSPARRRTSAAKITGSDSR